MPPLTLDFWNLVLPAVAAVATWLYNRQPAKPAPTPTPPTPGPAPNDHPVLSLLQQLLQRLLPLLPLQQGAELKAYTAGPEMTPTATGWTVRPPVVEAVAPPDRPA